MMTEKEFIEMCKGEYGSVRELDNITDFYDREKKFAEIMRELSRRLFESSISDVSTSDRRKKKTLCTFGEIEVAHTHPFSQAVNDFNISPMMQEKMVYAGQLDCYSNSEEVLLKMLDVEVSAMQVYRVTDTYGAMLEEAAQQEEVAADILEIKPGEAVYAMVDGTMVLTRQGWSETKLGRVFRAGDCMEQSKDRGWIKQSLYEGYLGSCSVFTDRFERKLDCYEYLKENLVFITDGAVWIKNWLRDAYPDATIALDFYHAYEHLCDFAKEYFKEEETKVRWLETQKALLLESGAANVIANIKGLSTRKKKVKEMKEKLLAYYQSNLDRMDYKRYSQIGAGLIGSGPIESAHRQVIQKRMKQSGQRWSIDGAQNMLQLRCCRLSNKWGKVISLIRSSTKAA